MKRFLHNLRLVICVTVLALFSSMAFPKDLVYLNVGGTESKVTKKILVEKSDYFKAMFSGNMPRGITLDDNGDYHANIWRPKKGFDLVLEYLYSDRLHTRNPDELALALAEADFYQIKPMATYVKELINCVKPKFTYLKYDRFMNVGISTFEEEYNTIVLSVNAVPVARRVLFKHRNRCPYQ